MVQMSHESLRFPLHWKYYALLGKAPFITSMLFVTRDDALLCYATIVVVQEIDKLVEIEVNSHERVANVGKLYVINARFNPLDGGRGNFGLEVESLERGGVSTISEF